MGPSDRLCRYHTQTSLSKQHVLERCLLVNLYLVKSLIYYLRHETVRIRDDTLITDCFPLLLRAQYYTFTSICNAVYLSHPASYELLSSNFATTGNLSQGTGMNNAVNLSNPHRSLFKPENSPAKSSVYI